MKRSNLSWSTKRTIVVKSDFNFHNWRHIKTVSNDTFEMVFGTPDWIRTSGLQSRSYQAVKLESPAVQGFGWCYTDFRHFEENLGSLIGQGFRGFSR